MADEKRARGLGEGAPTYQGRNLASTRSTKAGLGVNLPSFGAQHMAQSSISLAQQFGQASRQISESVDKGFGRAAAMERQELEGTQRAELFDRRAELADADKRKKEEKTRREQEIASYKVKRDAIFLDTGLDGQEKGEAINSLSDRFQITEEDMDMADNYANKYNKTEHTLNLKKRLTYDYDQGTADALDFEQTVSELGYTDLSQQQLLEVANTGGTFTQADGSKVDIFDDEDKRDEFLNRVADSQGNTKQWKGFTDTLYASEGQRVKRIKEKQQIEAAKQKPITKEAKELEKLENEYVKYNVKSTEDISNDLNAIESDSSGRRSILQSTTRPNDQTQIASFSDDPQTTIFNNSETSGMAIADTNMSRVNNLVEREGLTPIEATARVEADSKDIENSMNGVIINLAKESSEGSAAMTVQTLKTRLIEDLIPGNVKDANVVLQRKKLREFLDKTIDGSGSSIDSIKYNGTLDKGKVAYLGHMFRHTNETRHLPGGLETGFVSRYNNSRQTLTRTLKANDEKQLRQKFREQGSIPTQQIESDGLDTSAFEKEYGFNPLGVFQAESAMRPEATNKLSGAYGFFQIMPGKTKTAIEKQMGVAFEDMSPQQQVDAFPMYLKKAGVSPNKIKEESDLYMAVAAPAFVGKSGDTIVYKKGSKAVEQNPVWVDESGNITVDSIKAYYNKSRGVSKKVSEPTLKEKLATRGAKSTIGLATRLEDKKQVRVQEGGKIAKKKDMFSGMGIGGQGWVANPMTATSKQINEAEKLAKKNKNKKNNA